MLLCWMCLHYLYVKSCWLIAEVVFCHTYVYHRSVSHSLSTAEYSHWPLLIECLKAENKIKLKKQNIPRAHFKYRLSGMPVVCVWERDRQRLGACVCARLHCLCVNVASEVMRDSTEVIPEVLLWILLWLCLKTTTKKAPSAADLLSVTFLKCMHACVLKTCLTVKF